MPRMKIQSEVHLAQDIERIIRALMLGADAIPPGPYRDGYARGLQVVWEALCSEAGEEQPRRIPTTTVGMSGWEDIGIISKAGF